MTLLRTLLIASLTVAFLVCGYIYFLNCDGLDCSSDESPGISAVEYSSSRDIVIPYDILNKNTSGLTPEDIELINLFRQEKNTENQENNSNEATLDQKNIQYTVYEVNASPGLREAITVGLPLQTAIDISIGSLEFQGNLNQYINTANLLEVEFRYRLPSAMYAIQEAAIDGEIITALRKLSEARDERDAAQIIINDFENATNQLESSLQQPEISQQYLVAVTDSITRARMLLVQVNEFITHADHLLRPIPPTANDLNKLDTISIALDVALQDFVRGLQNIFLRDR